MSLNNVVPLDLLISGGVHSVPSVEDDPRIELIQWRIAKDKEGQAHFIGWSEKDWEGRVSSDIATFDRSTMTGTTKSGRKYRLEGDPDHNPDAEYVWYVWLRRNATEEVEDVSNSFSA